VRTPNAKRFMKVKELIKELQKHDPEKMVVVAGYEGGYDEISGAGEIRLKLNAHTEWYYGNHAGDDKGECHGIIIQGRRGLN
jgi:hypothetical protein